jgi:mannose-6-phosphate isomerase-like protein (cupin superfamily)
MKRSTFLRNLAAVGVLLTNSLPVIARKGNARPGKGFLVNSGKDRHDTPFLLSPNEAFFTKISTADTEGDVYTAEFSRVKKGGPPLHFHPEQDEWFYVLAGEFLFTMGEETIRAKAGDSVFIPRKVHHAFSKVNEETEEGRLLVMCQPAGKMESYFKGLGEGLFKTLSEAEWKKFQIEHGVVPV